MERYEALKNALLKEKNDLYEEKRLLRVRLSECKKIKSIISRFKEYDVANPDYGKVEKLRTFFPNNNKEFDLLKKFLSYKELIERGKTNSINLIEFEQEIRSSCSMYNVPPREALDDIVRLIHNLNNFSFERRSPGLFSGILLNEPNEGRNKYSIKSYIATICYTLALKIINSIEEVVEKEFEDLDFDKKDYEYDQRIKLIEKYSYKFSKTDLLTTFSSKEELDEFLALIKTLVDDSTYLEILKNIRDDQIKLETVVEEVTFYNLDLSSFTPEEKKVIEELREIYEDEGIKDSKVSFDENIDYDSRLKAYQDVSINDLLSDVKVLLQHVYDNKDVIKIFKLIIDLYNKNNLRILRDTMVSDLSRIKDDFNNIISFIHNTYKDQNKIYEETQVIESYIKAINDEYLPIAIELREEDIDFDEYYDNEIDEAVTKYKTIIKNWKKEMTLYYHVDDKVEEEKEDTDNLVFCLEDDIDLSDEGHQREFIGAIEALEMKSSRDLKKGSGRNGMTRLRKSTERGDEKDFVDYVNHNILRSRGSIHFVPYRYSNNPYYRTGLIKFEPSQVVKDFLEKRYGLSKQSAYYGVFQIIHSMGADHSEYKFFEEYLLGNYQRIEEIALLFASETPDFDKLVEIIEPMLKNKKDILARIESKK